MRLERAERQARWAADYVVGLAAREELRSDPSSHSREARRRIRSGERAIGLLMADLEGLIRHVLLREFGLRHDFDDLLQDARVHVLEMIRLWRPGHGASLSTWVVRYMPQTLRRQRRKSNELFRYGLLSMDADPAVSEHIADDAPTPDDLVLGATSWVRRELDEAIKILDPVDRELVGTLLDGRGSEMLSSERGRARAILAHPAFGLVGVVEATGALDVDGSAEWVTEAACLSLSVAGFFPQRGQTPPLDALRACMGCPVRTQCLAAVVSRTTWPGLWGGTSAKQRRTLRVIANRDEVTVELGEAA